MSEIRIDALLPQEMATRAEYLGVRKAEMPFLKMFMLSVLAGAFISLGAIFATTVSAGSMAITTASGDAAFSTGCSRTRSCRAADGRSLNPYAMLPATVCVGKSA